MSIDEYKQIWIARYQIIWGDEEGKRLYNQRMAKHHMAIEEIMKRHNIETVEEYFQRENPEFLNERVRLMRGKYHG